MVDLIDGAPDLYPMPNVLLDVLEVRLSLTMEDVLEGARAEVVQTDYAIALREEPLAEVASYKTSPAGN